MSESVKFELIELLTQLKKLNKLGLSLAKLKFSLVRVVNEVTDILNSVEIKIKVAVELLISLDLGLGLGLITKMCLDTTHPGTF